MKRLTIIFLLLCGSVAAQIPPQRDSLAARVLIRSKLPAAGTASTPLTTVYQAINDAQTPVCQDFDAYDKFDTLVVSSGSEGATLPADFLRIVSVDRMIGDTLRLNMQEMVPSEMWEKGGGKSGATYKTAEIEHPRYFQIQGNRLVVRPKDRKPSNRPDSLLVCYWAIGHKLTSADDSLDIQSDFREALLIKACANLYRIRQGAGSPDAAALEAQYAIEVQKYGRKK